MNVLRLSMVLLLIGTSGSPAVAQGQAQDSSGAASDTSAGGLSVVVERVVTAFSEGDASHLLDPSASRVEVSLFGTRTYYSSAQALYVLRKFFRSHAPRRFLVQDVMETKTSCFVRGRYEQARVTQWLQVYVRLSQSDEEEVWRLHEVNVELPRE